jgi:O-antigen ligase
MNRAVPFALAAFFAVVQFYTSFAPLSPTPPVGYVFASRLGAAALVAALFVAAAFLGWTVVRGVGPARDSVRMLAAWIGAAALASLFGFDPLSGFEVVAVMLVAALFHLALRRAYPEPAAGRAVVLTYLAVGVPAIGGALAMQALRTPAPLYALNHGRAAGFFVTANQFAAYLDAYAFVALGVALAARDRRLRAFAGGSALLAFVALGLTFSRSGWVGALAAGLFLAAQLRARAVLAALGVLCVAAAAIVALRPFARHDPADAFNRLATLEAGVRAAVLFPLTGAGPMAYWRVYPSLRLPNGAPPGTFGALHPHDAYLSWAGETGLVGVVALGVGWLVFVRAMRGALANAPAASRRFALGVAAGLVAVLVQGVFDTIGVVQVTFVWIPLTALALAGATNGLPWDAPEPARA